MSRCTTKVSISPTSRASRPMTTATGRASRCATEPSSPVSRARRSWRRWRRSGSGATAPTEHAVRAPERPRTRRWPSPEEAQTLRCGLTDRVARSRRADPNRGLGPPRPLVRGGSRLPRIRKHPRRRATSQPSRRTARPAPRRCAVRGLVARLRRRVNTRRHRFQGSVHSRATASGSSISRGAPSTTMVRSTCFDERRSGSTAATPRPSLPRSSRGLWSPGSG